MPRSSGGPERRGLATASLVAVTLGLLALLALGTGAVTPPAPNAGAGEDVDASGGADDGAGTGAVTPGGGAPRDDGPAAERGPVLALPTFTVLDDTYNSGLYGSLRTGPDGLPALSYYDDTNGALLYARCLDPSCADAATNVVDDDGVTGLSTSLAFGHDGFPVISYYDLGRGAVRLVWCLDDDCRQVKRTLVDAAVPDVTRTALTIAPDGRAEVAYAAGPSTELAGLSLARCDRDRCDRERVDGPNVGEYVASARHGDALVVVYRDEEARELRMVRCAPDCSISTPDGVVGGGLQPSVAFDGTGAPVLAHLDLAGQALRLVQCRDSACAAADVTVLADTAGAGFFPAVAVRADDAPTVAYYDELTRALWVASCDDRRCGEVARHVVDALGIVGLHTSLILDPDGAPVIAYHDQTNRHLKVAACANVTCEAPVEASTLGRDAATFLDDRGRPAIVYRAPRPRDIRVAGCVDVACRRTTVTPADSASFIGLHGTASAAGDGSALVTFYDSGTADLRLGVCEDAGCPFLEARDLATTGNVGAFAVQSLDGDQLAVAYLDRSRGAIRLVTCTAPACADDTTVTLAEVPAGAGQLAVAHRDGRPVVVHQHPGTGDLVLVTCDDARCRGHRTQVLAEDTGPLPVELVLAADGRPWVLHRDAASGELRLATCGDRRCAEPRTAVVSPVGVEASLALHDDHPVVAFLAEGRGLVLARCEDAACRATAETVLSTRVGLATSVAAAASGELLVGTLDLASGDPVLLRCPDPECDEVEHVDLLVRARS